MNKPTIQEISGLLDWLNACSSLPGAKFAYCVSKNREKITTYVKELEKGFGPTAEFVKYEEARIKLARSHAEKDENKEPKVENGQFVIKDKKAFKKAVEALKKEHKKAIDSRKKQIKSFEKLMQSEAKVELHKIKREDISSEINANQLDGIKMLIEE